jgi:hypothetical protein
VAYKTGEIEEGWRWPKDAMPIPRLTVEMHYLTEDYHYFAERTENGTDLGTGTILEHFRRVYQNRQSEGEKESGEAGDQEERQPDRQEQ